MTVKTNDELKAAIAELIKESGIKKVFIANKLNISGQAFAKLLDKQNFSLDDANRILDILGYELQSEIIKKVDKNNKKS